MKEGGYTLLHPVTGQEKQLFEKALKGIVGVGYEPLLAATQVVAGTNYCFICNATIPGKDAYWAKVTLFEPLSGQGEPVLTEIVRF